MEIIFAEDFPLTFTKEEDWPLAQEALNKLGKLPLQTSVQGQQETQDEFPEKGNCSKRNEQSSPSSKWSLNSRKVGNLSAKIEKNISANKFWRQKFFPLRGKSPK